MMFQFLPSFNILPVDTVRHEIDYEGVDPNAQDEEGRTVLHKYVANCSYDPHLMQNLIDKGADLERRNRTGKTAFLLAVVLRQKDMIETLIKNGAKVETSDDKGNTALHYISLSYMDLACEQYPVLRFNIQATYEILERLLKEGVDVNSTNELKETPLMWASRGSNYRVVKTLLNFGANVHLRDRTNSCCLQFATILDVRDPTNGIRWRQVDTRILWELIMNKACVNCFGLCDCTPLYYFLHSPAINSKLFAKDCIKAAALVNWKREIDFHLTKNMVLTDMKNERKLLKFAKLCFSEIACMRAYTLPSRHNLCEFACGQVSEDELEKSPEIRNEVLKIVAQESFQLYESILLKRLGRSYLRKRMMTLKIFARGESGDVLLTGGALYKISFFLDNNEILNVLTAFLEELHKDKKLKNTKKNVV